MDGPLAADVRREHHKLERRWLSEELEAETCEAKGSLVTSLVRKNVEAGSFERVSQCDVIDAAQSVALCKRAN